MATNYPGPYELRQYVSVALLGQTITHESRYNIRLDSDPGPGLEFDDYTIVLKANPPESLDTYRLAWQALVRAVYGTTASVDRYELWKNTPLTYEATFYSTVEVGLAGSSGAPNQPAGQVIQTFRTLEGGILKLNFMECTAVAGPKTSNPNSPTAFQNIAAFVLGDGGGFIGRDTSEPFGFGSYNPGQNEVLFKKRYRQV